MRSAAALRACLTTLLLACGIGTAAAADALFDLHGLAQVRLPSQFRFRGLDSVDRDPSPAAQLERHQDPRGLVFQFDAEASNDWGGHAKDPVLLNVLLLNPASPGPRPERRFSIARYFSPTGSTIALDDPRWQQRDLPGGRVLRWLAMDDHFSTDHAPRWAMSLYDPARALRLDFFAWRKRYSQAQAEGLLTGALDSLQPGPARAAHFARAGSPESRMDRLREARVAQFFAALVPLGVPRPAPGGTVFGPDTAAWLDDDGKALRVMRVLAGVTLPSSLPRAREGRPQLSLVLKPNQYPGPTMGGLPALPLQLLYWNPESGRWHRTDLQRSTVQEQHPLLPFEGAVTDRLPGRDRAYLVLQRHHYQPPVLDDAAEVDAFLVEAAHWRSELLTGRILALPAVPVRLR